MTSDAVKRSEVPDSVRPAKLGATPAQIKYMKDLVDRKPLDDAARRAANKRLDTQAAANVRHTDEHGPDATDWPYVLDGITKRDASKWIEKLLVKIDDPKRRPKNTKTVKMPLPDELPSGRYAILVGKEGVDQNDWHFYKVKRGTKNPAYVWVHRIAGDDEHELQFKEAHRIAWLIVAADIGHAARAYGEQKKACSRCGRGLTRRISRKLHIGPVCGGHYYQDWDDQVASARAELVAEGFDPDENID